MRLFQIGIVGFTSIVLSLGGAMAFGHGFSLSLSGGNMIEGTAGGSPPNLFTHSLSNGAGSWFTDHGGVSAKSGSSYVAPFDATDTFSIEFIGPLWYSNGGAAIPALSGTLTAESYSADSTPILLGQLDITGLTLNPGELPVSGASTHSIGWTLGGIDVPANAGAYGISYRVKGFDDGNQAAPFISSDPFVVIFHTSGLSPTDLANAQQAIYQSAVPEPGAIGLALASVGALAVGRRWRRMRQA